MAAIRRTAALAVVLLLAAAFGTGPAQAAAPADNFVGTAAGRALNLKLLGQESTFGVSNATGKSTLSAVSGAAGQLLNMVTTTAASVNRDNAKEVDPANGDMKCGPISLPAGVSSLLSLSTACSSSRAAITNGDPVSIGEGQVAALDLNASSVLKSLNTTVPLGSALSGLLAPVLDLVNQQSGAATQLGPTSSITDLLNALTTVKTLSVQLGKSSSELNTTAANVTSTATALGGQIDILPLAALGNTPLASIVIGSAKATASQERAGGNGAASVDPSLVTIKLASILGLPATTIPVRPGQTVTILQGTPLESTIVVADGRTENVKGSSKAVADGVSVHLLKGLSLGGASGAGLLGGGVGAQAAGGGILLELAHAEAAVVSSPAPPPPPAVLPRVDTVEQLPLTGPPSGLLFGGAVLLGVAYLTRRLVVGRS